MIIKPSLQYKSLGGAEAGELLRLPVGGSGCLAIYLERLQNGGHLICLLDHERLGAPSWMRFEGNPACLSFGADWFLTFHPGPKTFPRGGYLSAPGILHVQDTGVVITMQAVESPASQFDLMEYNLTTLQRDESSNNAAPVLVWEIWENEEAAAHARRCPLFTFEHRDE